jgi:hypothetical protein
METYEYPWYKKIEPGDNINQGDFILNCPILVPMHDVKIGTIKANLFEADIIIMSQSNYHLLNKCDMLNESNDYLVVDFRSVFSVPYSFLKEFSKKQTTRIRLMSPYREHLSQAFARFFMRVGLPTDIPQFS